MQQGAAIFGLRLPDPPLLGSQLRWASCVSLEPAVTDLGYQGLLFVILLAHVALGTMMTIELAQIQMLSKIRKCLWFCFVWLFPVLGPLISHKKLKIGWAKGDSAGGHSSTVPPDDHGF